MFDHNEFLANPSSMPCKTTKDLAEKHNAGFKQVGAMFSGLLGDSPAKEKATFDMIDTARLGWMSINVKKIALLVWVLIILCVLWILKFLGIETETWVANITNWLWLVFKSGSWLL
jgi:hypothetical protein